MPLLLLFSTLVAGFIAFHCVSRNYTTPAYFSRHIPLVALFSMLGKLAKADGVVTKEKIAVLENFMSQELHLDEQARSLMIKVFNYAKSSNELFELYAQHFYMHFQENPTILLAVIELMLKLASADKKFHQNEERMIFSAVNIFQVDYEIYYQIKENYFPETQKYYALLDCRPDDTPEKIKAKYRKLAMKYHPDRLQVHDLPDALKELANDKFKEIQQAYNALKTQRGF
jgi:DnaJ like chaperone protein